MPGYNRPPHDDVVGRLAAQLAQIERELRALQEPTATQKERVVERMGQAEQRITNVEGRTTSLEVYVQGLWAVDQGHDAQLDALEGRAASLETYVQGIWATNDAQNSRMDDLQRQVDMADGRITALGMAMRAYMNVLRAWLAIKLNDPSVPAPPAF